MIKCCKNQEKYEKIPLKWVKNVNGLINSVKIQKKVNGY